MGIAENIYLCQVNQKVSCGACCGLYNLPDLSRKKLETLLARRTKDFALVERSEDGIFEFRRKHKAPHRLLRPFPQFHHCPFLGLIGGQSGCVGCLLHPDVPGNNGVDYRSLSWYGEKACRTYFCPTVTKLPRNYQEIIKRAVDNWYSYGLIVTEHALVVAYFREIETRIGKRLEARDYEKNATAIDALRAFIDLKSKWPYRRNGAPGTCNYFFENGLYPRPSVFRSKADMRLSCYEEIFRELDSGFTSEKEIMQAEKLLDTLFFKAKQALDSR